MRNPSQQALRRPHTQGWGFGFSHSTLIRLPAPEQDLTVRQSVATRLPPVMVYFKPTVILPTGNGRRVVGRLQESIYIQAKPEQVFTLLADVERMPEWSKSVQAAREDER